jgi:hypothetical protein
MKEKKGSKKKAFLNFFCQKFSKIVFCENSLSLEVLEKKQTFDFFLDNSHIGLLKVSKIPNRPFFFFHFCFFQLNETSVFVL